MNVNVHIERLILDGLPASYADGSSIGAAVETELARLLATGGLVSSLQTGGAWANRPAPAIHLSTGKPSQIGGQIAKAIYGSLTPPPAFTHETHLSGPPTQ